MSLLSKADLRRRWLALATFAAVSALSAAPALADHGHQGGGGFWFPPIPQVFVPFPPVVVVGGPHGHGCDYDDHHGYYRGGYAHSGHGYRGGDGHGYRGGYYREDWRRHGRGRHRGHGHGHRGHGGHDD